MITHNRNDITAYAGIRRDCMFWKKMRMLIFIAISGLTLHGAAEQLACAPTWLMDNGRCYVAIATGMAWTNASLTCNKTNAYLVNIDDLTEQTLILNIRPPYPNLTHWIGLAFNGSDWVWTSKTRSTLHFLEVSNNTQGNECAAINHKGEWVATTCSAKLPFFCEGNAFDNEQWKYKTPHDAHAACNVTIPSDIYTVACTQEILCPGERLRHNGSDSPLLSLGFDGNTTYVKELLMLAELHIKENMTLTNCEKQADGAFEFFDRLLEGVTHNSSGSLHVVTNKAELLSGNWQLASGDIVFESSILGCRISGLQHFETIQEKEIQFATLVFDKEHQFHVNADESFKEDSCVYFLVSPVLTFSVFIRGHRMHMGPIFTMFFYDLAEETKRDFESRHPSTVVMWSASELVCAFFNISLRAWSRDGCSVKENDTFAVTCVCSHTTSFGILMRFETVQLSRGHEIALSVITYIGCSVSILTLFIALTVFTCIRSIQSERVFVHHNLCLSMMASNILFLAGTKAVSYKTVCKVTAVALQYSLTAVFSWTLVEGLHLYAQVVQVFGTTKSRCSYYAAIGWGIPILLTLVSSISDWEGYGSDTSCWLSIDRHTIWAFVGPVTSVMAVNMIILAMVMRIVVKSSHLEMAQSLKAAARAAVFLLPLMGLTWLFGLLMVNKDLVVFEYLFAVFNPLQGFLVFLFHCVWNNEVRESLRRIRERYMLNTSQQHRPTHCHAEEYRSQNINLSEANPSEPLKDRRLLLRIRRGAEWQLSDIDGVCANEIREVVQTGNTAAGTLNGH